VLWVGLMKDSGVQRWWQKFDIVRFLGTPGLRTLGAKLFTGIFSLTALAICRVCIVAYTSFSGTVESGAQLQSIARTAAEDSDLFLSENIQYAKSIAADDTVIDAAQRAAKEAERIGISAPPGPDRIDKLEEQFKEQRVIHRDTNAVSHVTC